MALTRRRRLAADERPPATAVAAAPVPAPRRPARRVQKDSSLEAAATQAGVLSQASREVAGSFAHVAQALTEMRSAIGEISSSTSVASTVADEAARDAELVSRRVGGLQEASDAIGAIAQLIASISQQSRMLALNATVEAARAGDAGRGFAVVANEVKELAGRTAQATEDIARQVAAVQQGTADAVAGVHRITDTLGQIAEAQTSIAAAVEQQNVAAGLMVDSVDRAARGSDRITDAVLQLAESQRVAYVRRALTVAEEVLAAAGDASLGDRPVRWSATDQATKHVTVVELPEFCVDGRWIGQNDDPRTPAPVVDEVVALVGGGCTLFQRMNAAGDMVRVATTVVTAAGRRNIGTSIARQAPDGSANPVLATVLAGETFVGPAVVADRPHFTAYEPLLDPAGAVIGMLYVGLPVAALPA